MHSAPDRDNYVTIYWQNIVERQKHNFGKYTNSQVSYFNTTYDYGSVMHYPKWAYSVNGKETIMAKVILN